VVRYAKRGPLRFASTRDLGRAFERAVRRAGVPIAYSAGFHPHPRLSYLTSAPTGAASQAEYLELRLSAVCDPDDVGTRLDAALPEGVAVLAVVDGGNGLAAGLAGRLECSRWRVAWPEVAAGVLAAAAARLAAADEAVVERAVRPSQAGQAKSRRVDVAPALLAVQAQGADTVVATIRAVEPAVRPEDIAEAIRALSAVDPGPRARYDCEARGPWLAEGRAIGDPLA
jgi:radical SAM-linked protein